MPATGPDHTAGTSSGALEPARVATPPARPSTGVLARLAGPLAGVGSLLLVELFSNPRARAAVRGLARSLGSRLASGTVPDRPVAAQRSAIACQLRVVEEPAAISVLVRCVETALAVPRPGQPPPMLPVEPPTGSPTEGRPSAARQGRPLRARATDSAAARFTGIVGFQLLPAQGPARAGPHPAAATPRPFRPVLPTHVAFTPLTNHHRAHTPLGGHPPISRVNNGPGSYT